MKITEQLLVEKIIENDREYNRIPSDPTIDNVTRRSNCLGKIELLGELLDILKK